MRKFKLLKMHFLCWSGVLKNKNKFVKIIVTTYKKIKAKEKILILNTLLPKFSEISGKKAEKKHRFISGFTKYINDKCMIQMHDQLNDY